MVRCADCGFLALRNRQTRQLCEVEIEVRESWNLPAGADRNYNMHEELPLCSRRAFDLRQETKGEKGNVLAVINADRECVAFTEWNQGFTPAEHQEMLHQQAFQEWQRKCELEDRQWREQVRKDDLEWKAKQEQLAGRQEKLAYRQLIVTGLIATAALVAAQIIAAFIPIWFGKN